MLITFSPIKNELIKPKSACCASPIRLQLKSQPTVDQVNFGYGFCLKNIPNLPCAYCGAIMVSQKEQMQFEKFIADAKGQDLQRALTRMFGDKKPCVEKEMAEEFVRASKQEPDKNLKELIFKMLKPAEEKIIAKQKGILNQAKDFSDNLIGEGKVFAKRDFDITNKLIENSNDDCSFKRKNILYAFKRLSKIETNPGNVQVFEKMIDVLKTLPTSGTDKNAFIVKYQRRTSREIGERLLNPYISTAEHIHPFSDKGASEASNYLLVDAKCNENRGDGPFSDFIEKNPNVIGFIKKNIATIVQKIKRGIIRDMDDYPLKVTNNLKIESNGKINIDPNES